MYVKIDSWHDLPDPHVWRTRCGMTPPVDAPTADEFHMDEKSCESCLRLRLHLEDKQEAAP